MYLSGTVAYGLQVVGSGQYLGVRRDCTGSNKDVGFRVSCLGITDTVSRAST